LPVYIGLAVQQFTISTTCNVRITYNGPSNYPIQIFRPGVDVKYGTPAFSDSTTTNPKILTNTLTTSGAWSIVINYGASTAYTFVPYTITV